MLKITITANEGTFSMSDSVEVYRNDAGAGDQLFQFLLGFMAKTGYTLNTKEEKQDGTDTAGEAS